MSDPAPRARNRTELAWTSDGREDARDGFEKQLVELTASETNEVDTTWRTRSDRASTRAFTCTGATR
jgi:hypothetical protein